MEQFDNIRADSKSQNAWVLAPDVAIKIGADFADERVWGLEFEDLW